MRGPRKKSNAGAVAEVAVAGDVPRKLCARCGQFPRLINLKYCGGCVAAYGAEESE
jgi:hypothetical protein